ncbi:MAG TPA: 23S rRNA (adenine(2503)-C(2))-methyltransferase RlmN [Firmicutes bacterium]|nr:23S rRNA (adenine(2503)-C(2))-methyltransferase RlmN [Bacillota bacterium]
MGSIYKAGPVNRDTEKVDLKGLLPGELGDFVTGLGEARYRGLQIFQWIHQKQVKSFDEMTNLPRGLRNRLAEEASLTNLSELARQVSEDGTIKFLFGLADGNAVEAVRMEYEHGFAACVSTQVGCRMGCAFCATGHGGFERNLSTGEIVDQVLRIQADLRSKDGAGDDEGREKRPENGEGSRKQRVGNVVLMGSGEPLDNYDASVKFMRIINDPNGLGISYRRITLSTCGLVHGIRRLASEGLPITLSVSLHAARDELRDELVPINRRFCIAELMQACREYAESTRRRVTFEYILLKGVNDGDADALALASLVGGFLSHVNLIPLNPVESAEFERPEPSRVRRFQRILEDHGVQATIRRELGSDIDAACGQLRSRSFGRS